MKTEFLVEKPEEKRELWRSGHKWEDKEIGHENVDWNHATYDREKRQAVVNMVLGLPVV
jgi:hypothetical protein